MYLHCLSLHRAIWRLSSTQSGAILQRHEANVKIDGWYTYWFDPCGAVLRLENDLIRPLCSLHHMEIIGPMIIASWKDPPPIIFMTLFDECCLNSFKAKKKHLAMQNLSILLISVIFQSHHLFIKEYRGKRYAIIRCQILSSGPNRVVTTRLKAYNSY